MKKKTISLIIPVQIYVKKMIPHKKTKEKKITQQYYVQFNPSLYLNIHCLLSKKINKPFCVR